MKNTLTGEVCFIDKEKLVFLQFGMLIKHDTGAKVVNQIYENIDFMRTSCFISIQREQKSDCPKTQVACLIFLSVC